jgi:hypothetical protein
MSSNSFQNKSPTCSFHLLPNELVDEILEYVFQEAVTTKYVFLAKSTFDEFSIYFDTKAFQNVDVQKVKYLLCNDTWIPMLTEMVSDFMAVSEQLEKNVRYVLGKVLKRYEDGKVEREEIVEMIMKDAKALIT